MGPRKLLVFDLETVPDVALARRLWPETEGLDDAGVTELILAKHKAQSSTGSDFPRPSFHKIVAVGCLLADVELTDGQESYHLRRLGCIGEEGDDERTLLERWLEFGAREPLRLVSFNGRGFDVPVIKLRALHHGLPAGWLFQRGDKWSNYTSRYDQIWHVDMADTLTDFGAARSLPKLDEVCTLANLPGKLDLDGSRVCDLFAAGQVNEIRDYCETDVLNTYLLYLKYQVLTGMLDPERLYQEMDAVKAMLAKEGPQKPHLQQFLDAWNTAEKKDEAR
jgi:predicted PolB exonuclease-like 3'-5' exonuclease